MDGYDNAEEKLVRLCQQGDGEAFRTLIEHYRTVIFGTAYLIVHNRQAAEEAVQEALVKIWRSISTLRSISSLKPWLLRIVANEARSQLRKKRVSTVPLEEAPDIADEGDAGDAIIENEIHLALKQAVAALTPEQREVITLHYFAELTIPEIALALSLNEGTVKSRLSRTLEQMRKHMVVTGLQASR